MAFTKNTEKKNNERTEYDVIITDAYDLDTKVKFDMKINGIYVNSCWLRKYNKDGNEKFIISLPSRSYVDNKTNETKFANYVFIPMDYDTVERIANLVILKLQEVTK